MVYSKHFVSAIKSGKKILRESNDSSPVVLLPFGSEFSILMKNLSSQRAVVKVSIDGADVLNGRSLIVNSNSDMELERFIKEMDRGNRFKFIEKTAQISDHRGDRVDDGVVRIEYQFEKPVPVMTTTYVYPQQTLYAKGNIFRGYDGGVYNDVIGSSHSGNRNSTLYSASVMNCSAVGSASGVVRGMSNISANTDGITVKGSVSEQKFSTGSVGALEDEKHVITIMLKGVSGSKFVTQAITTKLKSKCEICGAVFRGFPNNCSNCGAAINAAI